jgi:hypothetical protein
MYMYTYRYRCYSIACYMHAESVRDVDFRLCLGSRSPLLMTDVCHVSHYGSTNFFTTAPRDVLLRFCSLLGNPIFLRVMNRYTNHEVQTSPLNAAPLLFYGYDPRLSLDFLCGRFKANIDTKRFLIDIPAVPELSFLQTWEGPLSITVGRTIDRQRGNCPRVWPSDYVVKKLNNVTKQCQNIQSLRILFAIGWEGSKPSLELEGNDRLQSLEALKPSLQLEGYDRLQNLTLNVQFQDLNQFLDLCLTFAETLPKLLSLHIVIECVGCKNMVQSHDAKVKQFPNLRSLKIEGCVHASISVKGAAVTFLCGLVSGKLDVLDIRAFQLSRIRVIRTVLQTLSRFEELQSLDLSFFGLSKQSADLITESLPHLRGLRSLGLYYEPLRGASRLCFVPSLKELTSLKKLAMRIDSNGLSRAQIDSHNIPDLFDFPICANLVELDFVNHDDVFSRGLLSQGAFRGLQILSLENADVTIFDGGCWHNFPHLRVLRLVNCCGAYDRFFLAAEHLPNLEELCCSNWTRPGPTGRVERLKDAFPQFLRGIGTACSGLRRLTLWNLRVSRIEDAYREGLPELRETLHGLNRSTVRYSPYDALCNMRHLECLSFGKIDSLVDEVTFMMLYGWKAHNSVPFSKKPFLPHLKELHISCADEIFWFPAIREMSHLKTLRVECRCACPEIPDTFAYDLAAQLNLREKSFLRTLHLCFPEHPFRPRENSPASFGDEVNLQEAETALVYMLPRVAVSLRFSKSCTRGKLTYWP